MIAIVSALSVGNPFIQDYQLDDASDQEKESEDDDEEYTHLKSQAVIDKEKRKAMRRKYFGSLMVITPPNTNKSDSL